MRSELQVLVSTLDRADKSFYKELFAKSSDKVTCLIINQISDEGIDGQGIRSINRNMSCFASWINLEGKGLSVSRNVAIENASEEICLIADDDITYLDGFSNKIIYYHLLYPRYDILIFKARGPNGKPFREYPDKVKELTIKELGAVSSIEITFKLKRIKEKNLLFDERFGLGTKYPASEEWIFLTDALKKGIKILFIPEYIVEHPASSSGTKYDKKRILALGAALYRIYGVQAYLRWLVFPKNIRKIHLKYHSGLAFLFFFLKGIISFQLKGSK